MNEPITWREYFLYSWIADIIAILVPLAVLGIVKLIKFLDNDGKKWFKDKEEGGAQ